jgi:hypothetical protein
MLANKEKTPTVFHAFEKLDIQEQQWETLL